MDAEETDIIVVGMGPGGEDAAGRLAEAGLHVTGVEANLVGDECPYWGCVPSKMMIRAANLLAEARRIPGMAGTATVEPDWAPVAARIRDEATDSWNDKVAVDRFRARVATSSAAGAASPGCAKWRLAHPTAASGCFGPGGAYRSPPAPSRRCRPSRGWPGRRIGPTGRPSKPSRSRGL